MQVQTPLKSGRLFQPTTLNKQLVYKKKISKAVLQAVQEEKQIINIEQTKIKEVERLRQFCKQNQINIGDKVNIDFKQSYPILRANTKFELGQEILTIPETIWLTQNTVKQSSIASYVSDLEPWIQVVLYINGGLQIDNQRSTTDTPQQYTLSQIINVLQYNSSPFQWNEELMDMLKGTQVHGQIKQYRNFLQKKYDLLLQDYFSKNPDQFPSQVYTFENFLKSVGAVRSHIHEPLKFDQLALVPVNCLVSHSRLRSNVQMKIWEKGTGGIFNFGKKDDKTPLRQQTLVATRNIQEGEELAMEFQGSNEAQLFIDYGYFDETSDKATFTILQSLSQEDKFFDDKIDILEINGYGEQNKFEISQKGIALNQNFMAVLRLLNIQGPDSFLLESLFRNEVFEHLSEPISQSNEQLGIEYMIQAIESQLAQYPTTLEQDYELQDQLLNQIQKLRGDNFSHELAFLKCKELAIKVRLSEKFLLENSLKQFQVRLSQLDDIEYYQERRLKRLNLIDDDGRSTFEDMMKGN